MQDQNGRNSAALAECYQELGKYTRMVVANKRRTVGVERQQDIDAEIVDVEIGEQVKYGNKKYQLPAMLVQELGFYLLVGLLLSHTELLFFFCSMLHAQNLFHIRILYRVSTIKLHTLNVNKS